MKKAILIILAAVVLGAIALFAFVMLSAGSIAEKLKPEIEKAASEALGTRTTLGDLSFSLFPRTRFAAASFKVGEGESSLSLGELAFEVRLASLIKGNVEIIELALKNPTLSLTKDKDGIGLSGLPRKKKEAAKDKKAATPQEEAAEAPADSSAPLNLNLEHFTIENAKLHFKDETSAKEYSLDGLTIYSALALENEALKVKSFVLGATAQSSIAFTASAKDLDYGLKDGLVKIGNLDITLPPGKITISGDFNSKESTGELNLKTHIGMNLAELKALAPLAPALAELKVAGSIKPDLQVKPGKGGAWAITGPLLLNDVAYEAAGTQVTGLSGQLDLNLSDKAQEVKCAGVKLNYNGAALELANGSRLTPENFELQSLELLGFSGKVNARADYALKNKAFKSDFDAAGLNIAALLQMAKPGQAAPLSGTLESLKGNVSGKADANLKQNLAGNLSFLMKDGELAGVNLVGPVLKAISALPFMSGGDGGTPPEANAENTTIKSLSANAKIGAGKITTPDLKLESGLFSLEASGSAAFDGTLDLKASILFNREFSQSLAAKNSGVQKVLDAQGRLVVPLVIKGQAPGLTVLPDLSKLAKLGAKNAAADLLGKALGSKKLW